MTKKTDDAWKLFLAWYFNACSTLTEIFSTNAKSENWWTQKSEEISICTEFPPWRPCCQRTAGNPEGEPTCLEETHALWTPKNVKHLNVDLDAKEGEQKMIESRQDKIFQWTLPPRKPFKYYCTQAVLNSLHVVNLVGERSEPIIFA